MAYQTQIQGRRQSCELGAVRRTHFPDNQTVTEKNLLPKGLNSNTALLQCGMASSMIYRVDSYKQAWGSPFPEMKP